MILEENIIITGKKTPKSRRAVALGRGIEQFIDIVAQLLNLFFISKLKQVKKRQTEKSKHQHGNATKNTALK